jgi:hypothetical protein
MERVSDLSDAIIDELTRINLNEQRITNEEILEQNVLRLLQPIAKKYHRNIQTQPRANRERLQKPDIAIGINELYIELKILTGLGDLYRLFYQTIKYMKIVNSMLILFIWDRGNYLKEEDKKDLKSLEKPPKILKIITRK